MAEERADMTSSSHVPQFNSGIVTAREHIVVRREASQVNGTLVSLECSQNIARAQIANANLLIFTSGHDKLAVLSIARRVDHARESAQHFL